MSSDEAPTPDPTERENLRQALWDVYGILGFDQDGDRTPAACVDLIGTVVTAAKLERTEFECLLARIEQLEAERDAQRVATVEFFKQLDWLAIGEMAGFPTTGTQWAQVARVDKARRSLESVVLVPVEADTDE